MTNRALQFGPIQKARFVERPNRFLVRCHVDRLGIVEAFLPNPGRLWELLLPDATLFLTPAAELDDSLTSRRKTRHTVLAVERDGTPIFLHTHFTNRVARFLIERKRIPYLADTEVMRAEVPVGNSRFDFLLRKGGRDVYLEVKSCTLFGNGVAMFPDAVTERGQRHLLELASLGRRRARPVVLFLVHTPCVQWFMPDYHTDLAFSQSLLKVRNKVQVLPVAVEWNRDLSLGPDVKTLEVPWAYLRREVKDRGSYLLLLRLEKNTSIEVGRLGRFLFQRGYYLYVGSAMRNLTARIDRHSRQRKKLHWHIDYLRQAADRVIALPIRSSERQECEIAQAFSDVFPHGPNRFGSSDCNCTAHLFWHPTNPLEHQSFHAVLQQYRMNRPC